MMRASSDSVGVVLDPFTYGGAVHMVLPPCIPAPIQWPAQACECAPVMATTSSKVVLFDRAANAREVK